MDDDWTEGELRYPSHVETVDSEPQVVRTRRRQQASPIRRDDTPVDDYYVSNDADDGGYDPEAELMEAESAWVEESGDSEGEDDDEAAMPQVRRAPRSVHHSYCLSFW